MCSKSERSDSSSLTLRSLRSCSRRWVKDASGKAAAKRRKAPETEVRRGRAPVAATAEAAVPPASQALPTVTPKEEPKQVRVQPGPGLPRADAEAPTEAKPIPEADTKADNPTLLQASPPTSSPNSGAARLRERLRCKVIERHRQQSEQAVSKTSSSQEACASANPEVEEPAAKKEKKQKNKKAAKKEEPVQPKKDSQEPEVPKKEEESAEATEPVEAVTATDESTPVAQEIAKVGTKAKNKNAKAKKAQADKNESDSRSSSKETPPKPPTSRKSADPEVEAALQRLSRQPLAAPALRGPELLLEAQELLSRLEAEDLLRQLETEEERAKRAAGKKKAKKNKAAARAKAGAKKSPKSDAAADKPASAEPATQEADTEEDEPRAVEEDVGPALEMDPKEEKDSSNSSVEDSTEIHSLDGHESHSSSAPSDEERFQKKVSGSDEDSADGPTTAPPSPAEQVKESPSSRKASWADVEDESTLPSSAPPMPEKPRISRTTSAEAPQAPVQTMPVPRARAAKAAAKTRAWKGLAQAPAPREAVPASQPAQAQKVPRRRPWNYAEAATGQTLDASISADVVELMTAMGIVNSRDDLVAFIQANSSEHWRKRRGDLNNASFKDLSKMAADLLQKTEDHVADNSQLREWQASSSTQGPSDPSFNGAAAGLQILEFIRGGKVPPQQPANPKEEETSQLRAEAPEFVPGAAADTPAEVQPVMANMLMPDLPPGCQIVMVPVQLAQMPVFEEGMSGPSGMQMTGPGMQLVAMPMEPQSPPTSWDHYPGDGKEEPAPVINVDETDKEAVVPQEASVAPEVCGYNTDDESEIWDPPVMRRQLTF